MAMVVRRKAIVNIEKKVIYKITIFYAISMELLRINRTKLLVPSPPWQKNTFLTLSLSFPTCIFLTNPLQSTNPFTVVLDHFLNILTIQTKIIHKTRK